MREINQHGSRIRRLAVCGLTGLTFVVAADHADAQTQTADLQVTAKVIKNCTIAANTVDFGDYDPVVSHASTSLEAEGSLDIACTKGHAPLIDLDLGQNSLATQRRLSDGVADVLTYELYKDAARSAVWGTGPSGLTATPAINKNGRNFPVYGRVDAGQDVPANTYNDTVVATVNF